MAIAEAPVRKSAELGEALKGNRSLLQRTFSASLLHLAGTAPEMSVWETLAGKGVARKVIETVKKGLGNFPDSWQGLVDLQRTSRDAMLDLLQERGHHVPAFAEERPDPRQAYNDIPIAPLLVPKEGRQDVTSLNDAVDLLLAPGRKVLITENSDQMTLVSLLAQVKMLVMHHPHENSMSLGTATGGTTVNTRIALGLLQDWLNKHEGYGTKLPDLLQEIGVAEDELKAALGKIDGIATLDDYGWKPAALLNAFKRIGDRQIFPYTYRDEQWTLWVKRLIKDAKQFISPPIGMEDLRKAAAEFHRRLEKRTPIMQMHGIGTTGHDAFNEPGTNPLSSDAHVIIFDATRIQNIGAFLKPDEKRPLKIFLEAVALYGTYDTGSLKQKLLEILQGPLPEKLQHVAPDWEALKMDFDGNWNYLMELIERVPGEAITQGVGTATSRALFNILLADSERKAPAVQRAIEGDIDPQTTASGLQVAPCSAFVIEKRAARELTRTGDYFYLKLDAATANLLTHQSLERDYVRRGLAERPGTALNRAAYEIAAELNVPLATVQEHIAAIGMTGNIPLQ